MTLNAVVTPTLRPPAALEEWMRLVRAEYRESPGLRLTRQQVQRFWGLDPHTCDALLEALEASSFLKRTADAYVRADIW